MKIGGEVVNDVPPVEARHRHGVPVLCALPAHERLQQHGLRHEARPGEQGRDRQAGEAARPRSCSSRPTSTACRGRSPAASASASRSAAPSCRNPQVFLFDEPLSNLDAALRVATRIEIAKLSESMPNTTMIYVTHDQVEAMTLADRIVVLNAGLVEQVGSPMELYLHPDNLFVARFIGSPAMNTVPCVDRERRGDADGQAAGRDDGQGRCRDPRERQGRQGHLRRPPRGSDARRRGRAHLHRQGADRREARRGDADLRRLPAAKEPIIAKLTGDVNVERGADVGLTTATGHLHVFDENGISFPRA